LPSQCIDLTQCLLQAPALPVQLIHDLRQLGLRSARVGQSHPRHDEDGHQEPDADQSQQFHDYRLPRMWLTASTLGAYRRVI
jgi:hypothetical protein